MKRFIAIVLICLFSFTLFAACGEKDEVLSGKYFVTVYEIGGMDWLAFIKSMDEMADEIGENNPDVDDLYVEFKDGGKIVFSAEIDEEPMEGTFKVDGKNITLTVDGEEMKGIIDGNKITIEAEEDGTTLKMVFEKK